MRMRYPVLCLAAFLAVASALSYDRVHLVDVVPSQYHTNYLFRSNMPTNSSGQFAIDELISSFRKRATENGITLPSNFFLVDIQLNNLFDRDYAIEVEWWKHQASTFGQLVQWPLGLAGLVPPRYYPEEERRKMALDDVWKIDLIPSRVLELNEMLKRGRPDKPIVAFVHCEAGCDRTGEVIAAYRMQFTYKDTRKAFHANCVECHNRCANYYSATATEWFCLYLKYKYGMETGDCMDFAECEPFGHCKEKYPPSPQ